MPYYRFYIVFMLHPSAGGCPLCCSPLTKLSLLFAAIPSSPSPNQEGVLNSFGVPGCLPSCVSLHGPNWCCYFSWGSASSACCLDVQDGGGPIQPAGVPGCPHGAAEAAEGIRAVQPPLHPQEVRNVPYGGSPCGVSCHEWGSVPSTPTPLSGRQAAVDAKHSVSLVKQPAPQRAKATPYAGRQPV